MKAVGQVKKVGNVTVLETSIAFFFFAFSKVLP